ncbi:MAG: septum formation initiator family protein [Kordiimonadaceae bacterium]|nr:septum formation initiator family protein [Kordiimonadaceae bacterium]
MERIARISRSLTQSWATGISLLFVVYFGLPALQGDSSLSALKALEGQERALLSQAADVRAERLAMQHRVEKLGGSTLDPDLLEEQVRKRLGFVHSDEVILFLN